MHVEQYVYLGLNATRCTRTRSSIASASRPIMRRPAVPRGPEHDIPRCHLWHLECRDPYLWVQDLLVQLTERVGAAVPAVRSLVDSGEIVAVVQVVRHLSADSAAQHARPAVFNDLGEIPPQDRKLLGFHLEARHLEFILALGAELDVDEYDFTDHADDG